MKNVVDILNAKGIVLKSLVSIEPSLLKSRQKIRIFSGVNEKSFYNAIFELNNKSRFLKKDALRLLELEKKLEMLEKHAYRVKVLLISSPLCSIARKFLQENRWKIIEVQNDIV